MEIPLEVSVSRCDETVEYVVTFRFVPEQRATGPTADSGGEPGYPAEAVDIEVWHDREVPCAAHRFGPAVRSCRDCKTVREPRPELVALVDPEELLEHAMEESAGDEMGRADYERDRRKDEKLERRRED